jgi:N utilization substance protein B
MQALYLFDLNPSADASLLARFLAGRLADNDSRVFAAGLVEGTLRAQRDIDAVLEGVSDNWRVSRMAATDRSILRLALHEILHTDTPPRVACDEAVELAKRYGAAASARFVAGLLGRLLVERGDGRPPPGSDGQAPAAIGETDRPTGSRGLRKRPREHAPSSPPASAAPTAGAPGRRRKTEAG